MTRRATVLITGMSGTGKTSTIVALAARGYHGIDTDRPHWIDRFRGSTLFVAGCVANQGRLYDRFDAVVLLSAPLDVLLARVARRTNPFGSTPADRAKIAADLSVFEPLLRAGATHEIDTTAPATVVVDRLEEIAKSVRRGGDCL